MNCFRLLLCCTLSLLAGVAGAQIIPTKPASNLRSKTFVLVADSLILDSLSIVPNTVRIDGVADSLFTIETVPALLRWKNKPAIDSVRISYRVFPYKLNAVAQRMNYDSLARYSALAPFVFNSGSDDASTEGSRRLINFGNLEYNGSFGRELSVGNAQDAIVNSNFQLQLNGFLGDSIEIAAAITDNNIPIQPDGTTQQLNEFDQVYLQFKKKGWQLALGDIDLRQKDLYFLNFYKRLQGISFANTSRIGPKSTASTLVSGSVAKGRFTRNVFDGLEGNQGPYRLTGANNEFFFIVLAGTERVFIDGVLLQRGEDQDYVINYNTAEITFTPRRLITKDSRIQVEFEYADRNFLNSNLYLSQQLQLGSKLKIKLGAFQNSDARNSQINQVVDSRQRQFLYNLGDSVQKAFYPTATEEAFSRDRILYEKVFVIAPGGVDSFYRYSVDSLIARYAVNFTEVGVGQGDYIQDLNSANGKVFKYLPPVNGIKQGTYLPVTRLVTPKKQQLISLGGDYQLDKANNIKAEFAMSTFDANTFSDIDNGDDRGGAARLQYTNLTAISAGKGLQLTTNVDYEHVQQKFRPLERLRFVEFSREWGLPIVVDQQEENIVRLGTQLRNKQGHSLGYQVMNYRRGDGYNGVQHIVQHNQVTKGWAFANQLAMTRFSTPAQSGVFYKPVLDASKLFSRWNNLKVGARYALEENRITAAKSDSVTAQSFSFDILSAYIKTDETRKNKYALQAFTRRDKLPYFKNLSDADRSYNVNLSAEILSNPRHQLVLNTTYRQLQILNTAVSRQQKDETLLGRAEYSVREWAGALTGNVLYELGAGQEQRRDFAYFEVPAGRGEYAWVDYSGDGIQQLNEFEISPFRDQAKYVRIFIPTNQFVKGAYTTLNYNLSFVPRNLVKTDAPNRFTKFATRFSVQSSVQATRRVLAGDRLITKPFGAAINDTSLLSLSTAYGNTLSFNRFSSKWGADLANIQNSLKALLSYGFESRSVNDWILKLRWNISPSFAFNASTKDGRTKLLTGGLENRNYDLHVQYVEPQLVFIDRTVFRQLISYRAEGKKNDPQWGGERSLSQSIQSETKYNVLQNSSLTGRFTYNHIRYLYPTNKPVAFIMLDGLLPGSNYLWAVDFTKRILGNVELTLQYEGRKPAEARTIHVGRAAVRALF